MVIYKKRNNCKRFAEIYSLFHSFHTKYGNRGLNASTNKQDVSLKKISDVVTLGTFCYRDQ